VGGVRLWVREGFAFLFDASGTLREGPALCGPGAAGAYRGRAAVKRVSLGGGGAPFGLVRHYRRGGLLAGLLKDRFLGRARFCREVRVTELARRNGVPTVDILALRTERAGPGLYRADLVTQEIERARDLDAVLREARNAGPGAPAAWMGRAVSAVASLVRTMHDAGVLHADLNLKNILLRGLERGSPEGFVIDLDKSRVIRPLGARDRLRNLTRLYRSLEKLGHAGSAVSLREMARFVKVYCRGDRGLEHACRRRIRRPPLSLWMHRFFWRRGRG